MVTGGGMVIAAGVAGFIAGASVAMWMENQKQSYRPQYKRMGPPLGTPGHVEYKGMAEPGATGPVEETPA